MEWVIVKGDRKGRPYIYNCPMSNNNRTVWSSEDGDLRKKEQTVSHAKSLPPQQQIAYLHRESGGRGGKVVSVVKNLILTEEDLKSLAKKMKQESGTGGTVKDGVIEIQGEHRQRMAEVLTKLGYKVKIAGG
jgi:translation initiation factor 1